MSSNFIGQLKSDRQELYDVVRKYNSFLHTTNSWNCTTSLSVDEVSAIYQLTKFVPCPMGWIHPDSFRICECLENGSVPVVKRYEGKDYFENIFKYHPFPVVDDWSEIELLISNYSDFEYQELRKKCIFYYLSQKEIISNYIYQKLKF